MGIDAEDSGVFLADACMQVCIIIAPDYPADVGIIAVGARIMAPVHLDEQRAEPARVVHSYNIERLLEQYLCQT